MDNGDARSAAKLLEEITKQVPNDVAVIAELIGAYSTFDPKKAEKTTSRIGLKRKPMWEPKWEPKWEPFKFYLKSVMKITPIRRINCWC